MAYFAIAFVGNGGLLRDLAAALSLMGGGEMIQAVAFDLGGTLLEFRGMPPDWSSYYPAGLEEAGRSLGLHPSAQEIGEAAEILRGYNPRVRYREEEIPPERIFADAVKGWAVKPETGALIDAFFAGLHLEAATYGYAAGLLERCRRRGYRTACLTDLPNGMPDRLFRPAVGEIEGGLDLYASSQTCGVRKPNPGGLLYIAAQFGLSPAEILFVGDEEKDRRTAERAGCPFAWIQDFLAGEGGELG